MTSPPTPTALCRRAALLRGLMCASTLSPALVGRSTWAVPARASAAEPPPLASSAVATRSGLQFIDFRAGTGPQPRFGQLIRFNYVAYAPDPNAKPPLKLVDSTYDRRPYFTKHGNGLTCQGIEEALHTMKVGGRRRVVIPKELSYTGDKGPLPPSQDARDKLFDSVNSGTPIVFDLELVSVMDDLVDRGEYDDGDPDDLAKALRALSPPPPSPNPLVVPPSPPPLS